MEKDSDNEDSDLDRQAREDLDRELDKEFGYVGDRAAAQPQATKPTKCRKLEKPQTAEQLNKGGWSVSLYDRLLPFFAHINIA
jgi:hypothetical protein